MNGGMFVRLAKGARELCSNTSKDFLPEVALE